MKKLKLYLFLIVIISSLGLIGCSSQETVTNEANTVQVANEEKKEIRFKDILGREIVLEKPAERVFLGFYFESFLAINGSFDKVAVMSKGEWRDFFYSQYVKYEQDMPELKDIIDSGSIYCGKFSMEKLINANPDVAILAPFQYETLGENIQKLEAAGIPVVVVDYNAQTVEKHVASTEIIGKVMGKEERAKQLADEYVAAVKDVQKRVEKYKNSPKRVYIELANKGAKVYGNSYGNYMWGNLVKLAGGKNIAAGKIKSYGPLNPEYILAVDPEVIFFAGLTFSDPSKDFIPMGFNVDDEETQEKLKEYPNRPGWERLTAIKNKEVYCMDHSGLRSLYDYVYLQYIGKALYPEAFEDVDPIKNHNAFYEKYIPGIDANGNFMTKWRADNE
ncbi:ABC-type Fe3+-hydroxamate transport system, substrate-binding protein [Caminicella sporogenes DSM 14501]|uniref:ABC-type Fe3+-hydroxamate transport system, substrate-binding protein n=1 Tax=Caminicella sporogenes DSM 14501 TaxID=1121266 RepID=A0A1M6SHA9_9FIRM|nr:ABC transporter substrate-binding protein [Caminicella sporogenes]RKD26655.1 ABC transporter substrate-binding protein [Caminicella sporogenes]SHK44026.1 ABC-type Fe3+-hydroxamate transport system, substrate-binding protein [Caminicella sporogenes DSM 14501]